MNEVTLILEKTNGGLDVFKHYLGDFCTAGKFRNPYRKDEKASCKLYKNKTLGGGSYYYLQDYGDSNFCGNCFAIVAKLLSFNIRNEFKQVLEQIDKDMCLNVFSSYDKGFRGKTTQLKKVVSCGGNGQHSSIREFKTITKPFSEKELDYWRRYGIGESTLSEYNVKSIQSCIFVKQDGKSFGIVSSEILPIYGYVFNDGLGMKFYRPKAETRFMYAGELPKPYIFGWQQLPQTGEFVFITGGEKDVLSLAAHGYHGIALNSETAKVPETIMEELAKRFGKIVFLYDTDATGIQESTLRVEVFKDKFSVLRLQLPLKGTKQEKDISDYFSMGNTAQQFEDLLKNEYEAL